MLTYNKVLKEIGNPYLNLWAGDGYHYFEYDTGAIFETRSVMVPRLNDLDLESWIFEAHEFIKDMEGR